MPMKVVKKTDNFIIYARRDGRYAVTDGNRKAINGDDKVRILAEEGLVKVAAPAPKAEVPAEDTEASAEGTEETAAE